MFLYSYLVFVLLLGDSLLSLGHSLWHSLLGRLYRVLNVIYSGETVVGGWGGHHHVDHEKEGNQERKLEKNQSDGFDFGPTATSGGAIFRPTIRSKLLMTSKLSSLQPDD